MPLPGPNKSTLSRQGPLTRLGGLKDKNIGIGNSDALPKEVAVLTMLNFQA